MIKFTAALAALLMTSACAHVPAPAAASSCTMASAERRWIDGALDAWSFVRREKLHLTDSFRPTIILFDNRCRFEAPAGDALRWTGAEHGGSVALPDGNSIPPGVISFARTDKQDRAFFVMALPPVWQAAKITSGLDFDSFLTVVFLHEFMHTRQAYFVTPRLAAVAMPANNIPEGTGDDDAIKEHFKADPAYVTAYERERDLLYAAAGEPDLKKAKAIAAEALTAMRARQARWFVGPNAAWKEYDDIFLTMEGIGQWVGYSWLTDPRGKGIDAATAEREIRRKKANWTQEQGLALFLVLDRMLPGWQEMAFAPDPVMGIDLLARAVNAPPGT